VAVEDVHRHELTDVQWEQLRGVLPPRRRRHSVRGERNFINAAVFALKTGCPWRDLPERFGPWKTVYNRFARWARHGHWARIFSALQMGIDDTGALIDASIARAHQDACGGKGGPDAMLWAALAEVFRPRSTHSSMREGNRSTSR
jgi:transposase